MSSEISWRAIPRSNDHEERDRCTTAATLLTARWHSEEMDAKARQALFLADCCGVAYFKQFWNPNIGPLTVATVLAPHPVTGQLTSYPVDPDGNLLADDQGNPLDGETAGFKYRPGDTDTAVRSIFNIRVNPDAWGLEPSEGLRWLLDCDWIPVSVVKERWKERAAKVQANASGGQMFRQYERLVRALSPKPGQGLPGGDTATGRSQGLPDNDGTLLCEYWEPPSDLFPTGRLIVMAGEQLLFPLDPSEEGLPQGFLPYTAIYSERRPFDPSGRPVVDDLLSPQKVINKQWSLSIQEMHHQGVGQWVMFDVPGLSDQITNFAGAHIKIPTQSALGNRSIGDLIQRVPHGAVPPDRWRMIEQALKAMFDIGAFHEIQRGQVPPGVDSGIAVQLLQEAENGQLHDAVRTLKRSFISWGRQTGKMAKWGYGADEARWLPQHRPDLGYLVESVNGTDLPDFDQIDIDLEGFRPSSQAAFNAEIKEAMAQHWIEPRQGLQLMDLGRGIEGAFESQTRHYARARLENLDFQKHQFKAIEPPEGSPQAEMGSPFAFLHADNSPFLLPQDDDHLVHISVHQEIALDNLQPWPVRQAVLLHISEHRTMLQQQLITPPPPPQLKVSASLKGSLTDPEITQSLAAAGVHAPPAPKPRPNAASPASDSPPSPDRGTSDA